MGIFDWFTGKKKTTPPPEKKETVVKKNTETIKKPIVKNPTVKTVKKHLFNYKSLRSAVEQWLENSSKAEKKYGHISTWDTSNVTDMGKN